MGWDKNFKMQEGHFIHHCEMVEMM